MLLLLFCLLLGFVWLFFLSFFFPFSSLLYIEIRLCIRMIFTQLTNVFTGTVYTSAGSAIVASLVQAKHGRDNNVLAIFSLFF